MKWWKLLPFSMGGALASALFPGVGKALDNLGKSITGSGLTDAENEANDFTAQMQERQYELQREARQTEFQDKTESMLSAGLNPAMMYGGTSQGTQTVQTTSGSSIAPSGSGAAGIGALMNIISTGASVRSALAKAKLDEEYAKNQEYVRQLDQARARLTDVESDYKQLLIDSGIPQATADELSSRASSNRASAGLSEEKKNTEITLQDVNRSIKELNEAKTDFTDVQTSILKIEKDHADEYYELRNKLMKAQSLESLTSACYDFAKAVGQQLDNKYVKVVGTHVPSSTTAAIYGTIKDIIGNNESSALSIFQGIDSAQKNNPLLTAIDDALKEIQKK